MNYARMIHYDSANGPGIRSTLFLSGCNFHCDGCFNKVAQDFDYGEPLDEVHLSKFIKYCSSDTVEGISILGGEPFHQDINKLELLLHKLHNLHKPIWVWTGFTIEELLNDKHKREVLKYISVVVDGKFDKDKYDCDLVYRGSSNQRIIDIPHTLSSNHIVEIKEYY